MSRLDVLSGPMDNPLEEPLPSYEAEALDEELRAEAAQIRDEYAAKDARGKRIAASVARRRVAMKSEMGGPGSGPREGVSHPHVGKPKEGQPKEEQPKEGQPPVPVEVKRTKEETAALDKALMAVAPVPTPEQQKSIDAYVGFTGYDINAELRGVFPGSGHPENDAPYIAELNDHADNLTALLEGASLPEEVLVYRGIRDGQAPDGSTIDITAGLKPGDTFMDHGFMSTSTEKESFRSPTRLEIHAPAGTQAASIMGHSPKPEDHEVLFQRGTMMRVDAIEGARSTDRRNTIVVTVLPRPVGQRGDLFLEPAAARARRVAEAVARRRSELGGEGSGPKAGVDNPWYHRGGKGKAKESGSGTKEDPFVTSDVNKAALMISKGLHVQLNHKDEVATLLDKLAEIGKKSKEMGVKAPVFNLCNISVPDTNLFCADNVGVPRVQMPQLSGVPIPGSKADALPRDKFNPNEVNASDAFGQYLKDKGISITEENRLADHLRASQNELDGVKVAKVAQQIEGENGKPGITWPTERPIFVTKDGYIIDGHHTWAAVVGSEFETGKELSMPVNVIDMTITDALAAAKEFARDFGVPQKAVGAEAAARRIAAAVVRRRVAFGGPGSGPRAGVPHPHGGSGEKPAGSNPSSYKGYDLGPVENKEALSQAPEVISAAQDQRAAVAAAEPAISRSMIDLAEEHGAVMAGLEFRLKSEASLARKIADEMGSAENGGDPVVTAQNLNDIARYTMVLGDDQYASGVSGTLKDMEAAGYEIRAKNYWVPGDPYQGINVAVNDANTGVHFELQFHTPVSHDVKEPIHLDYVKYRESTDPKERRQLYDAMVVQAATIPVPGPPDALMGIGVPKFQPFTPLPEYMMHGAQ